EFRFEIQVQTVEMKERREDGVLYHAGYKGCVLSPKQLRVLDYLRKTIEAGDTSLRGVQRNIVEIHEILGEKQRIVFVPLPEEVTIADLIAMTVGKRNFAEVREYYRTSGEMVYVNSYSSMFEIFRRTDTANTIFGVVLGETNRDTEKAIIDKMKRAALINPPTTFEGQVLAYRLLGTK
ncbi:MAG: hypothetical protein PHU63_04755, partial [Candidatus ainarchaeum sp.]|nr:hypothetical protein [Candidatus ainarchaeum sp.]